MASEIPFTQYKLPDGRAVHVGIARPADIAEKAREIIDAGYRFECEIMIDGECSFTITDDDGDHAIEVCANGPEVPKAVDRLIANFQPNAA